MNTLAIILIIVNSLFFLTLAVAIVATVIEIKKSKTKLQQQVSDNTRSFRKIQTDLYEMFTTTNKEIKYKGQVFDVVEVYIVNDGELKVRLQDGLEFTKSVSIKDIQINEKQL